MFLPALGHQLAQAIPEPIRHKLGLQTTPATGFLPITPPDSYGRQEPGNSSALTYPYPMNPAGQPHATVPPIAGPWPPVAAIPSQTQKNAAPQTHRPQGWLSKLFHRDRGGPKQATGNPNGKPATSQPSLPENRVRDRAWTESKLKPLGVDELFHRYWKEVKPKKPKFSLRPDEIRVNPMRLEQEALEKEVFALPWRDDDVINPFHTGPCNVTE